MKNKVFLTSLFLLITACTSVAERPVAPTFSLQLSGALAKFSNQNLGESTGELKKNLGKPSETGTEKYESIEYQTLDYNSASGAPLAFYTINASNEVVGKSIWIAKDQQESDLNWLLRNRFEGIKFETYTPCKTHGAQKILVAREQGLFVGVDGRQVIFVSNCLPQLTDIRIKQFEIVCPQLQEHGSSEK